ncbi:MAG TPA: helix-turn-helix transcriptional regulator [Solirubrobacterales bacterium]
MASQECAACFAANLRRRRRVAGFSQEELGRRSGLHRTAIGLLERGARMPRVDTLVKLAAALEIQPDMLIEGISWTPGDAQPGEFSFALDRTRSVGLS